MTLMEKGLKSSNPANANLNKAKQVKNGVAPLLIKKLNILVFLFVVRNKK